MIRMATAIPALNREESSEAIHALLDRILDQMDRIQNTSDDVPEEDDSGNELDDPLRGIVSETTSAIVTQASRVRVTEVRTALLSLRKVIQKAASSILTQVLQHDKVRPLHALWLGLKRTVSDPEFPENGELGILPATQKDLVRDFRTAGGCIEESFLFTTLVRRNAYVTNGNPLIACSVDIAFGPGADGMAVIENLARLGQRGLLPFLVNASAAFFGAESLADISDKPRTLRDWYSKSADLAAYREFRRTAESRFVAICLPEICLRTPYGPERQQSEAFPEFDEKIRDSSKLTMGTASQAVLGRISAAAGRGWIAEIVGISSGKVPNLAQVQFRNDLGEKTGTNITTCIVIDDLMEGVLCNDYGFLPISFAQNANYGVIYAAGNTRRSIQGQNPDENAASELSTQLPYILPACDLAQQLHAKLRYQIGSSLTRAQLLKDLQSWADEFVLLDPDSSGLQARRDRPFRQIRVIETPIPGAADRYAYQLEIIPHYLLRAIKVTIFVCADAEPLPK